ncbi:P-loop containing nucleoside triphosphate hydrolase protein [Elaphomyces granulatus]
MAKFTPRQRKHKHKNHDGQSTTAQVDSNVLEILPISKAEKEERRQKLREELRIQQPNISAKKKKRLDKYIETKLKKEENLEILRKLAQNKVDTSNFQSSKNLGKPQRNDISRQITHKAPDENANEITLSLDFSDESAGSDLEPNVYASTITKESSFPVTVAAIPELGSGLKRPLELGEDGFPVLKKRMKRKANPIQEIPWEGFDSEGGNASDRNDYSEKSPNDFKCDTSNGESDSTAGDSSDLEERSESENEASEDHNITHIQPRNSAFKAWAIQQINEAVGFIPTAGHPISSQPLISNTKTPRNTVSEDDPLPPELQTTNGDPSRKAFSVQVNRSETVQRVRLGLPVVAEEQKIMEAIHNNLSVVIWGATGSGKTTQLPQFLFEAGYGNAESPNPGMIGVTQPRRVAAISMAKRVADELGQFSDQVSYQVRFDTTVSNKTAIKFMTDGILLREIVQDFSLRKYSVVIIDEAHERTVNTDILIGMISRIVDLRKSMSEKDPAVKTLKLVIMSATLRISDFTGNAHLFRHGAPPLVQAEGRQYPVTIHFSRRTHRNYIDEAFRKVSKGHRKLPPGGILVFLTGQTEIKQLSKRLKQAFKPTEWNDPVQARIQVSAVDAPLEAEDLELGGPGAANCHDVGDSDLEAHGVDDIEDDEAFDLGEEAMGSSAWIHVLPLYSQLPTKEQLKVFDPPPAGSRLIILATNVAETSLTIPGIRYVFDCGRAKEKQYDLFTGVQSFQIGWISKASASQRAGRAGRTGPGHCYRLYSSAIYESDFPEFTEPEILRTPIEGVVLQMKSMGLKNVINFPFPTPPSRQGLARAEKLLKNLSALKPDGQVTEIGHHLSEYPLSPRFGKMLQIGYQHGCMPYVIALVSALAVGDLFVPESQIDILNSKPEGDQHKIYTNTDRLEDTDRDKRRKEYKRVHRLLSKHDDTSDALKYLAAVCAYAYASDGDSFCDQMFLRYKSLKEASQLCRQLTDIVRANNPCILEAYEARLQEPSKKQLKALKQIVTAGFIDNIAIRADLAPVPPEMQHSPRRAIDVPYLTLFPSREDRATQLDEIAVYVHPSSVLAHLSSKEMPQYVVYSHLQQSAPSVVSDTSSRIRMFPLVSPSGLQLTALAHGTPLIAYGKPIGKIESLGGLPELRECWVIPSLVGEAGSTGWPLPARKVVQKKDLKDGWVIEKFLT